MTNLPKVAACAALVFGMAGQAKADLIATVTFNATLTGGSDTLGLDGSAITLVSTYNQNGFYGNQFGYPAINSLLNSLTIAGATVGSTNGTYTALNGVTFYPAYDGQFFDNSGNNLRYSVPGGTFSFDYLVALVGGINIGDPISPSDFGSARSSANVYNLELAGSQYRASNLSVVVTSSATAVPEPSSFLLGTAGAFGLAAVARRRARRASAA